MLIAKEKLEYYLGVAQEKKDEIKPLYNEVLELTDPFQTIKDDGTKGSGITRRNVDSTVVDSVDTLVSFIMSSILNRSGKWADVTVDAKTIIRDSGGKITGDDGFAITITEEDTSELDKYLQEDTDTVFKRIQNSNYYIEISKAMQSFVRVGTGAFAIRETGNTTNPFVYSYVGLDNLYILEDSLSRPNIVFKLHPEVNGEYIKDVFGQDANLPNISEEDLNSSISVYEVVIPSYDEATTQTKYNYMVLTEDMDTLIKEEQLDYNPFVVFRWGTIEGNPWGKSTVLTNIDIVKELEEYKAIFKTQARRIANPATAFSGNQELYYALSMEEGAMNYVGDPTTDGNQMGLQVLSNGSNLMPLDKVINELRASFQKSLMVDSIIMNGMSDGKNITAEFVKYAQEMFRKRFANTYELVNSELLEPTFMSPLNIMMKYKMLNITEEMIPYTIISYVNALSNAINTDEINKLLAYGNTIAQLNQQQQLGVYFNLPKTTAYVSNLLGIPKDLIPTEKELEQIQQAMLQQQQQIQQQGGMTGEQQTQA